MRRGRRRVFAVGLAMFTTSSLLCGIAGSGLELIGFRALQGIGGATVFATSLALLAQTFTGRERGTVLGIWGAVITLGLGSAPVLGGLLTELSWRLIFFVNIPVGVAAILMTLTGVQEFRPPGLRRIDLPGGGVFTLGLVALIYGLIESGSAGWGSDRVITALTVAAAALASFPLIERMRRQPMFDLSLLRKPTFTGGLAAAFGMNGLVTPPLASTAVRVVQPQDAGMASGINSTFRQIGIAISVAVLGSIFASRMGGATTATVAGHYASALNDVLLIAACVAFVAGGLALALIRPKDFRTDRAPTASDAGTPTASGLANA
jgi:MFS family permease